MRSIDVAAELSRLGIEVSTRASGEYRIRCPYHDDTHPSCDVSQSRQDFICRACRVRGGVIDLLCKLHGKPRHLVLASLETADDKPVEVSVIQRYHERIWSATALLQELKKRGVHESTIRRWLLGEHEGRITIPIASPAGLYVNIRKYLPGAKNTAKMLNQKGRSRPRLYPFTQLQYREIVLLGGEIKALACTEILNPHNIGAICLTAGEGDWVPAYEEYFRGKHVWVLGDIDDVGRRTSEYRCARISTVADWVGNVILPLDIKQYPTGDVNDYIAAGGDVLALLREASEWIPSTIGLLDQDDGDEPIQISIREALSPDMVDKRFKSKVSMTAMGQDSYFLPKEIIPICTKDQAMCAKCPVFSKPDGSKFSIHPESTSILSMIDCSERNLKDEVRLGLGIPECPVVDFKVASRYKAYETRVQRALNLTEHDSDRTAVPAVILDKEPELNETYEIVGRSVPHPRSQRCILVVSKADNVVDALTSFELTKPEELRRFRPREWTVEAIDEHLNPIYDELAANVTYIYERRELHQLIDLAYHSVLSIKIRDQLQKGWVEVLVVGDSSQGKSDASQRMQEYYQLGERVDCDNATPAGLLGGLEQVSGKWYVQWGVIPNNDRKLVLLEELKGLKPDALAKLKDMRSSGIAELPKILRRKAQARTRLIAMSNARKSNLESYSYGVNAILELVGSPEDVRRFDVCMTMSRKDIDANILNQIREYMPTTFSADMCRRLILWCWTRNGDQVIFEKDAIHEAIESTKMLCEEFSDNIPLLDRGGTRFKLLRLSAALAGRTFSATENFECIVVRKAHVQWIVRFLRTEYSRLTHGYLEFSNRTRKRELLVEPDKLKSHLTIIPNAMTVAEQLLLTDTFDCEDFCNWCNWTKDEANLLVGKLVRSNAIVRTGKGYTKTPVFTTLLRDIKLELPAHIKEELLNGETQY